MQQQVKVFKTMLDIVNDPNQPLQAKMNAVADFISNEAIPFLDEVSAAFEENHQLRNENEWFRQRFELLETIVKEYRERG